MNCDQVDSLEDWVAIKEHPFLDTKNKVRLNFYVAWNAIEAKVAITCRERARVASDTSEAKGWSGLYTFTELKSIHEQLSLVYPSLGQYLPDLPEEPRGVWAYISYQEVPDDSICSQLQNYLEIALDTCGHNLLIDTLFEEHSFEEYFENVSELKRRKYDVAVSNAQDQLENVLFLRDGSINMLDMSEVYKQEDEALFKYNIALAELYNYLIQPFLDMRELAFTKLREAKAGLENPNFGERRKAEFAAMFSEWQINYIHSLDRIQELYIEYYTKTNDLLSEVHNRMLDDQKRFGKKAFEITAQDRLLRITEDRCLEKTQLLQATKMHFEQQRDKVKQAIASISENSITIKQELSWLEQEIYRWQNLIYGVQIEVLEQEETIILSRIKAIKARKESDAAEGQFFDAVEDLDSGSSDDEGWNPHKDPELRALKNTISVINRKRAQIRNRKKAFVSQHEGKKQRIKEEEERLKRHHQVHSKRLEQKAEMEEKSNFIQDERKKTLERLRNYKMKYPSPATLKPGCKPPPRRAVPKRPVSKAGDQVDASSPRRASPPAGPPPPPPPVPPPASIPTVLPPISQLDHPASALPAGPSAPPAPPPPPPPPPLPPPPPTTPAISPVKKASVGNTVKKPDQLALADAPSSGLDLSAISQARHQLKRTSPNKDSPRSKGADPMNDMMQLIRQGVQLRPVKTSDQPPTPVATPSDEHTKQLQEVLERITQRLQVYSDDESDGSFDDD